ncbi:sodium- and chloride-dependent glycine transporter 2-like [Hetaerina americana]|uniref:sodium- and chloride-dependent glycine transporter 2-like n=1 Tax=Hetaerina americana TaxID=62018 RepID=UPI003A7F1313
MSAAAADRGKWGSPLEFVLSCLSYAVGLGNVWRFPYLCYRNGGGAFLVPHTIMLFLAGLPLFFLELVVGQYSSLGPSEAFKMMAPLFQGLGLATLVVIILVTIYYHIIIAWTILYAVDSFKAELPWGSCAYDFNTENCFSQLEDLKCIASETTSDEWYEYHTTAPISESLVLGWNATLAENKEHPLMTFWNQSCHSVVSLCTSRGLVALPNNRTHCFNTTLSQNVTAASLHSLLGRVLSSEEYYSRFVLGAGYGADWEHWGGIQWRVLVCLLVAWIIAAICLVKGVASAGKVMYFTALYPYVVLFALLIRGATLEGAADGIFYYISPQWETLSKAAVWGDAASQVFYALGLGCGSLVTLSSYSNFHNNCHRDAVIVTIVNCLTSILAGFSIFAVLGFLAHHMGVSVPDVVQSGPGLAFVAYPEAVLHMPQPQLWAVMFFFMLFCLGLGSQIAGLESITTAIMDKWPKLRAHKALVGVGTCACCFIAGIPMCFEGGVYLFTLLDWNSAAWSILIIGIAETVLIGWVYGPNRFLENIAEMGMKLPWAVKMYWKSCWVVMSPLLLLGILIFSLYEFTPAYYGTYFFPQWVDGIGWLLGAVSVIPLPLMAMYRIYKRREKGMELLKPTEDWGPAHLREKIMNDSHKESKFNYLGHDNTACEFDVINSQGMNI